MKFFQKVSLYSLSGVLLGIGFLYPTLWLLGIVGVALQLKIMLEDSYGCVWGSYLAWWIKFLFVLGFYWTIYPIKWLPFDLMGTELWLIGLYWLTVSLFVAMGGLVFGFLFKLIAGVLQGSPKLGYLLLPVIWVAGEVSGSFLLSIFTYGPGALLNAYFSLGYVGLLIGEHQLVVHLASFGGVYILSVLTVAFAVWLGHFNKTRHRIKNLLVPITVIFIVLLTNFISFPSSDRTGETTTVAVISTSFPVEELFDLDAVPQLLEEQDKAMAAALATGASYVVTPEGARFFNQQDGGERAINYFNFKYPDSDAVIIDSARVENTGTAVLQGFLFDSATNEPYQIHKKYLVPQGEFVPYFYAQLFQLVGMSHLVDTLNNTFAYRIGPDTSQADLPDSYPGVLFCFESSSAVGVRELVKDRPDLPFIAHPISHTWFNSPESLWSQLETSLAVQAIWNDIAIVSANNHGPSQMFLPSGEVKTPIVTDSGEFWEVGLFTVPVE